MRTVAVDGTVLLPEHIRLDVYVDGVRVKVHADNMRRSFGLTRYYKSAGQKTLDVVCFREGDLTAPVAWGRYGFRIEGERANHVQNIDSYIQIGQPPLVSSLDARHATPLLRMIGKHEGPVGLRRFFRALARITSTEAFEVSVEALDHDDKHLAEAASNLLASIVGPRHFEQIQGKPRLPVSELQRRFRDWKSAERIEEAAQRLDGLPQARPWWHGEPYSRYWQADDHQQWRIQLPKRED